MGRWQGTAMKMKIGDEGLGEMGRRRGTAMWDSDEDKDQR